MSLHVVLVEPEIHWNTGNIGRTALAVGATLHLIEPLGFSLDDKNLRRADYWPRVSADHARQVIWYDTRHSDGNGPRVEIYHARLEP